MFIFDLIVITTKSKIEPQLQFDKATNCKYPLLYSAISIAQDLGRLRLRLRTTALRPPDRLPPPPYTGDIVRFRARENSNPINQPRWFRAQLHFIAWRNCWSLNEYARSIFAALIFFGRANRNMWGNLFFSRSPFYSWNCWDWYSYVCSDNTVLSWTILVNKYLCCHYQEIMRKLPWLLKL